MPAEKNNLIARIKKGDSSAESELFNHYKERISTTVKVRIGKNNHICEDICSEIHLALLEKLREGKYNPAKGTLSGYIYGITLNKIKDYYKSAKKRNEIYQDRLPPNIPDDAESSKVDQQELHKIIRDVVNSLKSKYKEVIYLRYYEELSISEIANLLKMEPRRVSERINYAIKLIQKKCSETNIFSIFANMMLILLQKGHFA